MHSTDFEDLKSFIENRIGIVLREEQHKTLENRLVPILRRNELDGVSSLVTTLMREPDDELAMDVIDAITMRETFFFRDESPFNALAERVFPVFSETREKTRPLRVWSCATSTGQEAYSVAMTAEQILRLNWDGDLDILGTDVSKYAVGKARTGAYSQIDVQRTVPARIMVRYFEKNKTRWQLQQSIRNQVRFRQFNLIDTFSKLGEFDIIFCRNVLSSFGEEKRHDVLSRLAKQLAPDGVLVVGTLETLLGETAGFKPVKGARGFYTLAEPKEVLPDIPLQARQSTG